MRFFAKEFWWIAHFHIVYGLERRIIILVQGVWIQQFPEAWMKSTRRSYEMQLFIHFLLVWTCGNAKFTIYSRTQYNSMHSKKLLSILKNTEKTATLPPRRKPIWEQLKSVEGLRRRLGSLASWNYCKIVPDADRGTDKHDIGWDRVVTEYIFTSKM